MLTEHSGVLCFLSLEEATGLWVTVPNSIVSPWCQLPEGCRTHYGATEETAKALAGLVLTVSPRGMFPSMLWFKSMLQK